MVYCTMLCNARWISLRYLCSLYCLLEDTIALREGMLLKNMSRKKNKIVYFIRIYQHNLTKIPTPLHVFKISKPISQGQPLSCSVTEAIFIPQRMTWLSLSSLFTLYTKVDVQFVKHKWGKCRTSFPIKRTSNVNISETTSNTHQRATPFCSVRNKNIAMRSGRWYRSYMT
jgi:hypothetical protein